MIQDIKDRVPVNVLSNDAIRYGIYDEQGNLIRYEHIKREDEPIEKGTPVNRALLSNIQGDLYTQDRYNTPEMDENRVLILDLPLTSYETGKIINLIGGRYLDKSNETTYAGNIIPDYWTQVSATDYTEYRYPEDVNTKMYVSSVVDPRYNLDKTPPYAFDSNTNTFYMSELSTEAYMMIEFSEPKKITKMATYVTADSTSQLFENMSIQGSNDKEEWIDLYNFTSYQTAVQAVELNNTDYYKAYRIKVDFGYENSLRIYEWECTEYARYANTISTIINPYININKLGGKKINGAVRYGEKISLVYNGESFDILYKIPSGIICMWSGSIDTIPIGWALCDGNNGTPNLLDRFIVGAGSTYAVGDTGGSNTVTLTVEQIPAHSHGYTQPSGSYYNSEYLESRGSVDTSSGTTGKTGGGKPHENRPPYYALAYIMKI